MRLAAAERQLAAIVAQQPAARSDADARTHRTLEIDRATARVRYWRQLQLGASNHPDAIIARRSFKSPGAPGRVTP